MKAILKKFQLQRLFIQDSKIISLERLVKIQMMIVKCDARIGMYRDECWVNEGQFYCTSFTKSRLTKFRTIKKYLQNRFNNSLSQINKY